MKAFPPSQIYRLVLNRYKDHFREAVNVKARCESSFPALFDTNFNEFCSKEIPQQAQVVICGGGLVGCSVAFHLARDFGWKDVVILEQSRYKIKVVDVNMFEFFLFLDITVLLFLFRT